MCLYVLPESHWDRPSSMIKVIALRCAGFDRVWLGLLLGLSLLWSSRPAQGAGQESVQSSTARLLEKRREQQIVAAQPMKVFYGFQFTDQIQESQILFEHH